jgi:hypothetical protein
LGYLLDIGSHLGVRGFLLAERSEVQTSGPLLAITLSTKGAMVAEIIRGLRDLESFGAKVSHRTDLNDSTGLGVSPRNISHLV